MLRVDVLRPAPDVFRHSTQFIAQHTHNHLHTPMDNLAFLIWPTRMFLDCAGKHPEYPERAHADTRRARKIPHRKAPGLDQLLSETAGVYKNLTRKLDVRETPQSHCTSYEHVTHESWDTHVYISNLICVWHQCKVATLPLLLVCFGCKGVAVIDWTVGGGILVPARQSQKSKSNEINMLQVEGGHERVGKARRRWRPSQGGLWLCATSLKINTCT